MRNKNILQCWAWCSERFNDLSKVTLRFFKVNQRINIWTRTRTQVLWLPNQNLCHLFELPSHFPVHYHLYHHLLAYTSCNCQRAEAGSEELSNGSVFVFIAWLLRSPWASVATCQGNRERILCEDIQGWHGRILKMALNELCLSVPVPLRTVTLKLIPWRCGIYFLTPWTSVGLQIELADRMGWKQPSEASKLKP